MNLQEYRDQNQKVKPNASILERWQTRVVARGLSGAEGARQYLADYGKGIGAKKALMLARQAELSGDIPMSEIFYAKAHALEYGEPPTGSLTAGETTHAVLAAPAQKDVSLPGIPDDMQPGKLAPMQPEDARRDRDYYIKSDLYWGQPKIDGQKALVFATAQGVAYQSRSLRLRESPSAEMDQVLMNHARLIGPFILEGELTYLDVEGGEHRTGAQAATYNLAHGAPQTQPKMQYVIFSALYSAGVGHRTYGEAVLCGETIAAALNLLCDTFRRIDTYATIQEKRALAEKQEKQGREGEVWFRPNMSYSPGKDSMDMYVRTKHLVELEANITNVYPATAEGHTISGFEITDDEGKVLGIIGTGYTRADQEEILARFKAGNARARICCQGFTENGFVWHGRFIGWAK